MWSPRRTPGAYWGWALTGDLKNFLYSPQGKAYLDEKYNRDEKSVREIADLLGTHAMAIVRAMDSHGLARRDRAEAQKTALQKGRAEPPTRGPRTEASKRAIAAGVRRAWTDGRYDRREQSARARERWGRMTPDQQQNFSDKGMAALRTSRSPLKRAVFESVRGACPAAEADAKRYLGGWEITLDVWLDRGKVGVDVLGPADLHPVFGPTDLRKRRERAETRRKAVLAAGGCLVVVKSRRRQLGAQARREAAAAVAELVERLSKVRPPVGERVVEYEVQ
jgi:hypothetical protein